MASYKEVAISGSKSKRFYEITIFNGGESAPVVMAKEEEILVVNDEVIKRPSGTLCRTFDASENFPERNPATGELTGKEINAMSVYIALYSYIMFMDDQKSK